jgi:hypothetical protein
MNPLLSRSMDSKHFVTSAFMRDSEDIHLVHVYIYIFTCIYINTYACIHMNVYAFTYPGKYVFILYIYNNTYT